MYEAVAAAIFRSCGMLRGGESGLRKIDECLAAGAGVIVWTAHLGNWEFASRLLEMHGRTVHSRGWWRTTRRSSCCAT